MLELLQSNNMASLVNTFCQRNIEHSTDPFQATTVVVQSFGIGQWLKLQLAERTGISANVDCILPADLIWRLYQQFLPKQQLPDESPFTRQLLTWRLMQLLPGCTGPAFSAVQQYLAGPGDPQLRLFQLSETIAGLYDQYLIYRPDWIIEWQSGTDNAAQPWQSLLWRQLVAMPGMDKGQHRASLHEAFLSTLPGSDTPSPELNTISVFGLSSLPVMHLQTLQVVAGFTNVDIYFLNPCEHYWGDIVSEKDLAKRSIRKLISVTGPLEDEDYLEVGNPLLSSFGKQGREFLELLLETEHLVVQEYFEASINETALAETKNDILNLEFGGIFYHEQVRAPGRKDLNNSDISIQLHCCHSRMREVEILFDQLLHVIDRHQNSDSEITTGDIIVMAPDISQYAPFIQAVFQNKLYFSITDRSINQESAVLVAFEKLVSLPNSRLSATEVMDFLEVPTIANKFNLDESDLSTLIYWIRETGIRWEADGASKLENWDLPESEHYTWVFGLKRLLLGYAMQADLGVGNAVYGDIAPFEVGASDAELIGTLCYIIDLLSQYRARLNQPQTASEWLLTLTNLLEDFFAADNDEELALTSVRESLVQLTEQTALTDFDTQISPRMLQYWINRQLSNQQQTGGFISGGITFATLVPMRSVPFKVVCLLGMNDREYPRQDKTPRFDLMADEYRKGDRSRRIDDRYLFLEALLSAQQYFYVSYEGRSLKDNKIKPASVLVAELDDYLVRIYGKSAVVEHPLQPFSENYFSTKYPELISYQSCWYRALTQQVLTTAFIDRVLPTSPLHQLSTLTQLTEFFRNPARYFLRHRLEVYFSENDNELQDTESFDLDGLERYQLADSALQTMVGDLSIETWQIQQRANGSVMDGQLGEKQLQRELDKATQVYAELQTMITGSPSAIAGSLELDEVWLSGEVVSFGDQYIDFRTGTLRKRQVLEAWIKHLFVNALGNNVVTPLLSTENEKPVKGLLHALTTSDALGHLNDLKRLFHQGINTPLKFLPETSWSLVKSLNKHQDVALAHEAAQHTYNLDQPGSEGLDRSYARLFTFPNDFNDDFKVIAEEIYLPIIRYSEGIK